MVTMAGLSRQPLNRLNKSYNERGRVGDTMNLVPGAIAGAGGIFSQ